MHCTLMLLFSALLYWRGEQVALGVRHFATRLAGKRGDAAVLLAAQAVRAVALGVVVTAPYRRCWAVSAWRFPAYRTRPSLPLSC